MPDAIAALERLTDAVADARDLEEIFERALDCLRHAVEARRAAVLLYDDEGVMRFVAHRGLSDEYRQAVEGHSPWPRDAVSPQPVIIEDARSDPELAALAPVLERESIRALGFIPLVYGGRLLGKFMVYYDAPHRIEPSALRAARVVAGNIAFAVAQLRSRAALADAKDELETILAAVADAILVQDPDGRIRYLNHAAAVLIGFASAEAAVAAGVSVDTLAERYEIASEAGAPLGAEELPSHRAVRSRGPEHGALRFRERSTGNERWHRATAQPVVGAEGRVRFVVLVLREVTTYRHALEAAREAEQRKDEFLAMLGHELRNPLSPIVTALSLMELAEPARFERERAIIGRQVRHMLRLVDDLLDVSRITRGKLDLARETLDVRDLVRRALEMVGPLCEQRRHHVEVDLPAEPLFVDGDPDRLGQVLSNLLTNAAKYTEPGGHLRIRASQRGGQLQLSVHDDGIGIEPALMPQLFDLFVQGRQHIDRSRGGLGLGLTIVKRLVELHGGTVRVESPGPGQGTSAHVTLPLASIRRAKPSSSPAMERAGTARGERVLVVDDNDDAAETIASTLDALGYRTAVAHDGPTALATAASFAPDVAVLDIGLPVMDGYELARRLREDAPELRLIALTGYGQPRDRDRAMRAGFEVHLVKPVELTQLLAALTP